MRRAIAPREGSTRRAIFCRCPAARSLGDEPPKVIDLTEALKRRLMDKGALPTQAKGKRAKPIDRRQPQMLMPVGGGKVKKPAVEAKPAPAAAPAGRRKKAG